jgi:ornithine racemase
MSATDAQWSSHLATTIVDASSDHLVLRSTELFPIGTELEFGVNYSALLRAMTSPYVTKHLHAFVQ